MTKTEIKLEFTTCETAVKVPAVIVAAGASTRMNGINKQLAEINGVPVIIRTLMAFQNCDAISNIVLVVKSDDIFSMQCICEKYNIQKLTDIVCGGDNRQQSVLNGIARIDKNTEKVLIHDGARPLVSDKIIRTVISGLEKYSACACAVKVKDTIKEISDNGNIIKTVPRENLVAVQTPQGVRVDEYLKAVNNSDVAVFTDDVSIMEAAGYCCGIVEGDYKNIKITTAEDLISAEAFLESNND